MGFEQFYQKEIVKIWKQPNSKSIAVLTKFYLLLVVKLSIFLAKGHEKEPPANVLWTFSSCLINLVNTSAVEILQQT